MPAWRDNLKHLRIPFQMTLAPIFLWGWFLARPGVNWRLPAAFFAYHFLLYPGITAFNSWYDRDEGPIGGLERPPGVRDSLLPPALALKSAGFALALVCGPSVAAIYAAFVALSVLYSHPRFRWKARPVASAAVVCLGQGGLGFAAGWAAARGDVASAATDTGVLGLATAALATLGMYPVTQVYQVEEDRARGDRTLAVWLGRDGAMRLSQVSLALACAAAIALAVRRLTGLDALLLAAGFGALIGFVERLRRSPNPGFRDAMRVAYGGAAGFLLFIGLRMANWRG